MDRTGKQCGSLKGKKEQQGNFYLQSERERGKISGIQNEKKGLDNLILTGYTDSKRSKRK